MDKWPENFATKCLFKNILFHTNFDEQLNDNF